MRPLDRIGLAAVFFGASCHNVGNGDAMDTHDISASDSGSDSGTDAQTDSGGHSNTDSGVLPTCDPNEGRRHVTCPYVIPERFYPDSGQGEPDAPWIHFRTSDWIPFPDRERDEPSDDGRYIDWYETDPSVVVGALSCCVRALVSTWHPWSRVDLIIGPDPDQPGICMLYILGTGFAGQGVDPWYSDGPPSLSRWGTQCEVPIPWDVPTWLYSDNSPILSDLPSNCHEVDLSIAQRVQPLLSGPQPDLAGAMRLLFGAKP